MSESENANGSKSFVCAEYLDISSVGVLHEELKKLFNSEELVIFLDGENIEKADAAGLQLMAAFFKDAKTQGISLQWHKPSDALVNASRLIGLNSLLDLAA